MKSLLVIILTIFICFYEQGAQTITPCITGCSLNNQEVQWNIIAESQITITIPSSNCPSCIVYYKQKTCPDQRFIQLLITGIAFSDANVNCCDPALKNLQIVELLALAVKTIKESTTLRNQWQNILSSPSFLPDKEGSLQIILSSCWKRGIWQTTPLGFAFKRQWLPCEATPCCTSTFQISGKPCFKIGDCVNYRSFGCSFGGGVPMNQFTDYSHKLDPPATFHSDDCNLRADVDPWECEQVCDKILKKICESNEQK